LRNVKPIILTQASIGSAPPIRPPIPMPSIRDIETTSKRRAQKKWHNDLVISQNRDGCVYRLCAKQDWY
jgi:hypothetical protein